MIIMETSVKFLRLVTGEDVIADTTIVQMNDDVQYTLNNPMKVMYVTTDKSGTLSVSLVQWVFWRICDKQDFTLQAKDILLVQDASSSMEDYYWSSLEYMESYKEKILAKANEEEDTVYEEQTNDDDLLKSVIEMLRDTKRTVH